LKNKPLLIRSIYKYTLGYITQLVKYMIIISCEISECHMYLQGILVCYYRYPAVSIDNSNNNNGRLMMIIIIIAIIIINKQI